MPSRNGVPVEFVWRFSRDPCEDSRIRKRYTALVRAHIGELNNKHEGEWVAKAELYPVERLGFSGSAVFYMDIYNRTDTNAHRFIAKFQNRSKVREEYHSALEFETAGLTNVWKYLGSGRAAEALLVYGIARIPGRDATEFRNCFVGTTTSTEACCRSIDCLYSTQVLQYLEHRLADPNQSIKTIKEGYKDHLHEDSIRPVAKLASYVRAVNHGLSQEARKALRFFQNNIEQGSMGRKRFLSRLIHGDLHARNFMVSRRDPNLVALIDFAWGGYNHPPKDFTLLETTIKYMLVSEVAAENNPPEARYVPLDIYEEFEQRLCDAGLTLPPTPNLGRNTPLSLMRAWKCIRVLRMHAKTFLQAYQENCRDVLGCQEFSTPEQEYFLSLYLVSLGMFAFPTVEQVWVLSGCNILSNWLR